MLKLFLLGIGLFLLFEGLMYYFLSGNLKKLLAQMENIDPQKIKTISLLMILVGTCLIYFTFRTYGDLL
tara:strand:+ start:266 stop:472 length:207 start_codon:yes stop_codon:yes gene_type:complete